MTELMRFGLISLVVLPFLCISLLAENLNYSALPTEKLIDELMRIDNPAPGIASLGIYDAFLAEDKPPRFAGGVLGVRQPDIPVQMRELARRGIKALPLLMEHLSDNRSTQLVIGNTPNFHFLFQTYGSEYDPRHHDKKRQQQVLSFAEEQMFTGPYSVKVADICYVLIGQIVNRNLTAVRYQPTGGLVVNSPIQSPALAKNVKRDWSHIDGKTLEASLLTDVRADNNRLSKAALVRLRYYYPNRYHRLRGTELAKRQEFEAEELGYGEQAGEFSRQGKYSEAVKEWAKWIRHAPNSTEGYQRRGLEHDNAGQPAKAIRDYSHAIKLEKREKILDMLLQRRANSYEILGKYAKARADRRYAIKNYAKIAQKSPEDFEYRMLGKRYEENGQYELALKQYNHAIKINQKDFFARKNRAKIYHKLKRIPEALADYKKMLDLDARNPGVALESRAEMFMALGRLQEALADITAATTPDRDFPSHPPYPPYINTRARIYLAMNKPHEAITDFTRVIDIGVGELSTYFGRGNAYERIGSPDLAITDYKKCLTAAARNNSQIKMQRKARIRLKQLSS